MKKQNVITKYGTILILQICLCIQCMSQNNTEGFIYKRATNCNCYLFVNPNATYSFSWSGSCIDNYCNGSGTANYYDASGNLFQTYVGDVKMGKKDGYGTISRVFNDGKLYNTYVGNFTNGVFNGYGKSYNTDDGSEYDGNFDMGNETGYGELYYPNNGTLHFKGFFTNGNYNNQTAIELFGTVLCNLILNKVFDGGTNLKYNLVFANYSRGYSTYELRYQMTFNGNQNTNNFYKCTLIFKSEAPYIDFVNYNDMAGLYILYKIAQVGQDLYNELNSKVPKN